MYGFVHLAAATPRVNPANPRKNALKIIEQTGKAYKDSIDLIVFPELCITGYTCHDLFLHRRLINEAVRQLFFIADSLREMDILAVVGLPVPFEGKLYNAAAVCHKGEVKGIVPKTYLPDYGEFYESRYFTESFSGIKEIIIENKKIPFGTDLLFCSGENKDFIFAVEICEDLWTVVPPSCGHAMAGATVILNLSADYEMAGKGEYRRSMVSSQSARLLGGYVYANAGYGESTTDFVFTGHNLICGDGEVIGESEPFENGIIYGSVDVSYMAAKRQKMNTFRMDDSKYQKIYFNSEEKKRRPVYPVSKTPFVPEDGISGEKRCEEVIMIQSLGLKKRIEHVGCENVCLGVSGGLDSTHALLVTVKAFDMLNLSRKGIHAVTMPCFGTSGRTYQNAVALSDVFGLSFHEINIKDSVIKHFEDIGQDENNRDVTYENAQARERTQILMDMANKLNGFVIGTGDLSELALGFATYNGDHMSMYNVNASVPKTLMRRLIRYMADKSENRLSKTLYDILDTPVSPELLPAEQITENILGPYELHDFFLYNFIEKGFSRDKILYLAGIAFKGLYDDEEIKKYLDIFIKRFFTQQYKRSCMPDGPKTGSVSLSPRGSFRMASDVGFDLFIQI